MGISSYGGDPRVVATRAEIERVQAGLASVGNLLGGEVEVTDFLTSPLKRIGLAMELPALQDRIQYLLQALNAAANEYFDGEALVAKELTDLGLISAPIIAAGILGLTPYLERYPRALSGGQRQRVAMGRAIVRDPQVFLFDEPLSNLDAKLRVQMRTEIKELHQRLKTTTVYVTHDQIEAMTMADKIVVMQGGRIEQVGAPLDLYDRPANVFVAAFIGSPSMNLIEGRVSGGMVEVSGARLPLPAGISADEGREVIYGIRPEHLHQADQGLTGTVSVIEPTGSETHVVLRLAGRDLTAVFRNRVAFVPGDTITLAPDAAASHLFDKATGQRI